MPTMNDVLNRQPSVTAIVSLWREPVSFIYTAPVIDLYNGIVLHGNTSYLSHNNIKTEAYNTLLETLTSLTCVEIF
jgi:hypothetical protein